MIISFLFFFPFLFESDFTFSLSRFGALSDGERGNARASMRLPFPELTF